MRLLFGESWGWNHVAVEQDMLETWRLRDPRRVASEPAAACLKTGRKRNGAVRSVESEGQPRP